MSPLVSVVMPVYNAEEFISDAISSILNQTYTHFEFIIVNDGSTDGSLSIIEQYAIRDRRIRVINRGNLGISFSLNEAISVSSGVYVARMDADDISLPTRLEHQVNAMSRSKLDICGGNYYVIDKFGKVIDVLRCVRTHCLCQLALLYKVPFAHPTVMINKSFLTQNCLQYRNVPAEDLDLWARMSYAGARFGNVDDYLLKYRYLSTSLSRRKRVAIRTSTLRILKEYRKYMSRSLPKWQKFFNSQLSREEYSVITRSLYYLNAYKNTSALQLCRILSNIPLSVSLHAFLGLIKNELFIK